MVLSSYAKINLSLRINSKRKDGLHEIQSYFCLINLSDKINLKKIKEKKDKIIFKGPFSKLVNKKNNSNKVNLTSSSKIIKKPISLDNDDKEGFKKAFDKKKKKDAKNKKEDLTNKGILSSAKISEERFLKSWKKINAPYPVIDQDLGSFRTQSKSVRIICRDFQYPDGDKVTILSLIHI